MQNTLELFTASSGKQSARVRLADNTVRHLHSTVKPEDEANYFTDVDYWGNIIVFTGFGLGYHLKNKINKLPPHALVVVIDYYDLFIETAISQTFINTPATIIAVSQTTWPTKQCSLADALQKIITPQIQTIKHPASYTVHTEFYDAVLLDIHSSIRKINTPSIQQKKIMLLHGNFFLQEECGRAIHEISNQPLILFNYEKVQTSYEYESLLQKTIQAEKPDLILSINMKGFDGNGILGINAARFGIPCAVWFVDDPHPILLSQKKFITQDMYAFCWEKAYLPFLQKCGFKKVEWLPLATDPSLFFSNTPSSPAIVLGFVGSSMGSRFLYDIRSKFLWTDSLDPLVEIAADTLLHNPDQNITALFRKALSESGIAAPFTDDRNITWLCSYIIHTASMKKRKRLINALLPSGIELFGDPVGWRELVGPQVKVHPDIDYRSRLAATYRSIAININTTSCQMPSAVNQRVFDIPMAGSFVLSDNQKDMDELFKTGKEAVCYNSVEELKDLLSFYKTNQSARETISKHARKRILQEHTYKHRISSIINFL